MLKLIDTKQIVFDNTNIHVLFNSKPAKHTVARINRS